MFELIAAAMLDMQRLAPGATGDCRPRQHVLRSAPPPPAFSIERLEPRGGERTSLSAFRCPDGIGWNVVLYAREGERHDYVLGSECPEALRWIEAVTRLPIPNPALAQPEGPLGGTTRFVLTADFVTGSGPGADMRLTLVEQRDQPPHPIATWAREGEAMFARCEAVRVEWAR